MSEKDLKNISKTDWERLRTMTDEEIDTSDIPLLDDDFFANAKLRMPEGKVSLLVNIDEDIVDWYKEKGIDMSQFLNSALRDYADAHRQ